MKINLKKKIMAVMSTIFMMVSILCFSGLNASAVSGIVNVTNSCYINAAVQHIYSDETLRNKIISGNWTEGNQPVLFGLKFLFEKMNDGDNITGDNMLYFLSLINNLQGNSSARDSIFYKSKAGESVDYYNFLINNCIFESNKITSHMSLKDNFTGNEPYHKISLSVLSSNWYGWNINNLFNDGIKLYDKGYIGTE